ncbi:MAG: glycosyl transferase group 1, partial [Actinotalea sp.]|nr:glycosyl transferase group 1 [Actinotalea sp.]
YGQAVLAELEATRRDARRAGSPTTGTRTTGSAAARRTTARVRVLESVRAPRPTTNPYVTLLLRSLPESLDVRTFSWREALLGRYDVLHVHWPDVVVERRSRVKALGAAVVLALVLLRARLSGTALVRTAHNVQPHEQTWAPTRAVLRLCDRWTTWWIRLNDATPIPPGEPATTILHGHFRDWYGGDPTIRPQPGRLVSFGLIRPYKGMDQLVEAFAAAPGDLTLRVLGRPTTPDAATVLVAAAADDPRLSVRLEHVPDDDLAEEIRRAELVVLPYRQMHNSSTVLLALSLDRPVLVPANEVTDALATEVGEAFVLRYDGRLDAAALARAVEQVRAAGGSDQGRPDLSGREWAAIGEQHAEVFRAAAARARGHRGSRPPTA